MEAASGSSRHTPERLPGSKFWGWHGQGHGETWRCASGQRNPRFGCPRIAQQINLAFGLELDKDTVRGVFAVHYKTYPQSRGPSFLGNTAIEPSSNNIAGISDFRWKEHCRGLFELPVAD